MVLLKLDFLATATFAVIILVASKEGNHKTHVKGLRCNASEKYAYPNITCFARSYSRTFTGINVAVYAKKPMYDVEMIIKLYFKYGTIYREVMTTPKFDICTLNALLKKDKTLVNRWVAVIAEMVEDVAPGVIHECPYTSLIVKNRSLNLDALPSLFPTGDYKMIFICSKKEEFLGSLNMIYSIASANRDTFG